MHRSRKLMRTERKHERSSESFNVMLPSWNKTSSSQPQCHKDFPSLNGDISSVEKPSTRNLDVVFSNLHHIAPPKENVGCVRRTEISLGITDPARKVQMSGDWTTAWNMTIKATAYAFPHWDNELQQWGDYISSEFSARQTGTHHKLIAFDKAVRTHMGGGQAILLTDQNEFSYLYSAFLLPDGFQTGKQGTSDQRVRSTSSDICQSFNSTGGCCSAAGTCHYWDVLQMQTIHHFHFHWGQLEWCRGMIMWLHW